jgi:hypothetical protein
VRRAPDCGLWGDVVGQPVFAETGSGVLFSFSISLVMGVGLLGLRVAAFLAERWCWCTIVFSMGFPIPTSLAVGAPAPFPA